MNLSPAELFAEFDEPAFDGAINPQSSNHQKDPILGGHRERYPRYPRHSSRDSSRDSRHFSFSMGAVSSHDASLAFHDSALASSAFHGHSVGHHGLLAS